MELRIIRNLVAAVMVLVGSHLGASRHAQGLASAGPAAGQATYSTYLPMISAVPNGANWPMVAANPQRTSYTSEEVPPAPVEWYRVIEPFIGLNFQPVLATTSGYPNGLLFLATSRGLYTFRADTGATVWKFNTELPLGNSPTYDNQVVYVPGFDRRLYALDANTGVKLWEYAGAGAGYDTNPLVVEGKVILGNHDGWLYAVGTNGQPVWKYQTGGPIRFSSAYKSGVVYTVSNDGYLYANRASDGTLLWKSNPQMHGDGFDSYWPVVYTDQFSGKDYVIVAGSNNFRQESRPGNLSLACGGYPFCDWQDAWNGTISGTLGQVIASEPWATGRVEVDFINTLSEYYANDPAIVLHYHKPWRHQFFIFDSNTGLEYTMPSASGHPTYLPAYPILTNSGNIYPVVIGKDNLIYFGSAWDATGQARIMGWKFGTSRMVIQGLQQSLDEPSSVSAGGNLIYKVLCCDRNAAAAPISGSGGGSFALQPPGYDAMWWFPSDGGPNNLDRLYGNYGGLPSTMSGVACGNSAGTGNCSVNGLYGEHGNQRPLVPFRGRIYAIQSNAVVVFGAAGGSHQLPKVTYVAVNSGPDTGIVRTDLSSRLESEVQKIVTAGHLRPGYYNSGQFNGALPAINDYFSAPGDTIYALSVAYPYLSPALQSQVKTYLAVEFANFDTINWQGAAREWMPVAPEVQADMQTVSAKGQIDKYYIYGLWKYATNVAPENRAVIIAKAQTILSVASNFGSPVLSQAVSNRNAAGDVGWAGLNGGSTVVASCGWFAKDTPQTTINFDGGYADRTLDLSRNFLFLVPEVGACLASNPAIIPAMHEYEWLGPYWFVSGYMGSIAESAAQNLYDSPSMFAAKAYIEKLPREQLVKYLDVPAFRQGDIFYIQNLVAAIQAPSSGQATALNPRR